jgi:UMF1 family MFS transporter
MSWSAGSKHVLAWYSYAFAAEVFSACALAIFLPITLEQMAREVGFVAPGLSIPCGTSEEGEVCKTKVLGMWGDTASFR